MSSINKLQSGRRLDPFHGRFGKDNGGAIPSNLLQIPNSESNGAYLSGCKSISVKQHPARFPSKLPEFFIRMLTNPGDFVVDIFAGSNTTGFVAETEGRQWIAFENNLDYLAASVFRFLPKANKADFQVAYDTIIPGQTYSLLGLNTPSQPTLL
jgi:site-specific DNA-methyltransferase (cytosine-N4-specific)